MEDINDYILNALIVAFSSLEVFHQFDDMSNKYTVQYVYSYNSIIFMNYTILLNAICNELFSRFTLFTNYCRDLKKRRKIKTFIVKPANGAMGNG